MRRIWRAYPARSWPEMAARNSNVMAEENKASTNNSIFVVKNAILLWRALLAAPARSSRLHVLTINRAFIALISKLVLLRRRDGNRAPAGVINAGGARILR